MCKYLRFPRCAEAEGQPGGGGTEMTSTSTTDARILEFGMLEGRLRVVVVVVARVVIFCFHCCCSSYCCCCFAVFLFFCIRNGWKIAWATIQNDEKLNRTFSLHTLKWFGQLSISQIPSKFSQDYEDINLAFIYLCLVFYMVTKVWKVFESCWHVRDEFSSLRTTQRIRTSCRPNRAKNSHESVGRTHFRIRYIRQNCIEIYLLISRLVPVE